MRRALAAFLIGMSALAFAGCGAQGETEDPHAPGAKAKDYSSLTEREFVQPDEFYDFGDYDRVKVFHLQDGTECAIFHPGSGNSSSGDGGGITCGWPQAQETTAP